MNPKIRKGLAIGLSIGLAACFAPVDREGDAPAPASRAPASPSGDTGSVGMQLTIPGGAQIKAVSWTISGPNGATTVVQSGSVNVGESGGTAFLVSGIAPSSGYDVVLSAISTNGGVSCVGSATFAVLPRATTQVDVQMGCNVTNQGGQTTFNGASFDCAAWNTVDATPAETAVGSSVALSATATGPSLANLTYQWSAPSGTFSAANAASTSFTCTRSGPVVVTLTVGDGAVPEGSTCNPALDTDTVTVTCNSGAPAVPALPPWGMFALAIGMMGLGSWASWRRTAV